MKDFQALGETSIPLKENTARQYRRFLHFLVFRFFQAPDPIRICVVSNEQ
jgi:hypothetical protein